MLGLEVLSQQTIPIIQYGTTWALPLALVFAVISVFISCFIDYKLFYFAFVLFVTVCMFGLMTYDLSAETKIGEYIEYKVIISDEVNFNDFNNKYDILNQDGKIYTIKEKDLK